MEILQMIGFSVMLLTTAAVALGCGMWGAVTKRPVLLFVGLLGAGVTILIQSPDPDSPSAIAGAAVIGGATFAAIFGAIQSSGFTARFLMSVGLMMTAGIAAFATFGTIAMVPAEAETNRMILEVLAWSIVAPVGLMGLLELRWDFFGVGVTAAR